MNQDQAPPSVLRPTPSKLSVERETSSIPRSGSEGSNSEHVPSTGAKPSGRWIYPSEEMFFNAMKRKEWDPKAEDMRTIVPIHNAVNERAWKEIQEWEAGRGSEKYNPSVHFTSEPLTGGGVGGTDAAGRNSFLSRGTRRS